MPACHRCRSLLASAEVRRVRADSKKLPPGTYVCKDKQACRRRRGLSVDHEARARSSRLQWKAERGLS